jgi:uncharacterized membrane protein YqiK
MLIEAILLLVVFVILMIFIFPGFKIVRDDEVGIVTKKMFGEKLPKGRIIATSGEVGVQADTLMPGLYWRFPIIWSIKKADVTHIASGKLGIVESIEGSPIPQGRLLGDEVECSSYQDAKAFLDNGGFKGPQIAILRPGVYRINTDVFHIQAVNATTIPKDKVGIAIALDGTSLKSGFIVAPAPAGDHKHFQDGQGFIKNNGYRGAQLETLQPGEYYVNPLLFEIATSDVAQVPPGYVAVIVSSVGEELDKPSGSAPEINTDPNLSGTIHDAVESVLITDKNKRGILKDPVSPGKYNLNTIAYKPELVPTSAITIDWALSEGQKETNYVGKGSDTMISSVKVSEFFSFNQLKVTSKDGFQLDVDVRLIIRIPPANAPFVIARFGSVHNLIEQVAHPLIDSSFRNEAGNKAAMEFVHSRTALQENALSKARSEFDKYHVEVQGLLIAYIRVDEKLLETQTKKEIAVQQQEQYRQEAAAQDSRIAVAEKTARADKQTDVIAAKLSIDIAADKAEAFRRESEGIRDATKMKADGTSYELEQVGKANASAYKAQADVLGSNNLAFINIIQKISDGKVIITPQTLITGGESGNTSSLFSAFMAKLLTDGSETTPSNVVKKK